MTLPASQKAEATNSDKPKRLLSLDAYRGFIMVMLASGGFGILRLARLPDDAPVWQMFDYEVWQRLAFHFDHPTWDSQFCVVGVSFWDLIQPAFMFMVGVSMPYSYARRQGLGHSKWRQFGHVLWRVLVLVLMGVFLQSQGAKQTNWSFVNVLTQIGLGYILLYLIMGRRWFVQAIAFAGILVGYWLFFKIDWDPADYDHAAVAAANETVFEGRFAPWSKNANAGHQFDLWFLNRFTQPGDEFQFNGGGYVTLNFVPSIATMLLGVFCGQLLRSDRNAWAKLGILVGAGAVCMLLAVAADATVCPIVKRIWTPSWVLFSGAWVIWMLAAFYLVFDLCCLRWVAFPLAVVGMNSIVMYLMGQLMRPWAVKTSLTHFSGLLESMCGPNFLAPDMYGPIVEPTLALILFWLVVFWMYCQKIFVRV